MVKVNKVVVAYCCSLYDKDHSRQKPYLSCFIRSSQPQSVKCSVHSPLTFMISNGTEYSFILFL